MFKRDLIKERRLELGLTLREVAKKTGITAAAISCYENGTKTPVLTNAEKLAKVYGLSIDEMCGMPTKTVVKQQDAMQAYMLLYAICGENLKNKPEWLSAFIKSYEKYAALLRRGDITDDMMMPWLESQMRNAEDEVNM